MNLTYLISQCAYEYPDNVLMMLSQVVSSIRTLTPEIGSYYGNRLVRLIGTIPMRYQGNTYYTPMIFWIPLGFPRAPPIVFVNPTPQMQIVRGHPHVRDDGVVFCPSLSNWKFGSHMNVLINELSGIFGKNPPVRSKATPTQQQPNYSYQQSQYHYGVNSSPQPTYGNTQYHQQSQQQPIQQSYQHRVIDIIRRKLEAFRSQQQKLMNECTRDQAHLERRKKLQDDQVLSIKNEKESIEENIAAYKTHIENISQYIDTKKNEEIDIDRIISYDDALMQQMTSVVSKDQAISDSIYVLECAVANDHLGADDFVKKIRSLAREQFKQRALVFKCRKLQSDLKDQGGN